MMPALLLVLPAAAVLSASSEFVRAAEECRARPGSTAPAGSGWYYRINRADHRRCWFLMTKNASAHVPRPRHSAAESKDGAPQEQQAAAQPQIASSPIELADAPLPAAETTASQVAAPALDAATKYLIPRSVPTITFRRPLPDARTPLGPISETARATGQTSAPVGNFTSTPVVLAEVAATGLLFAGGGLFLTHLLRRRPQKRTVSRRHERQMGAPLKVPVVRSPPTASKLPNTAPVAADDLTQSLRELRRNLRRAEASIQRRFNEHAFSSRSGEMALGAQARSFQAANE
jgi:hypothetical protein